MRHTEFWERLNSAVGHAHARSYADQQVLPGLRNRTIDEALTAGVDPKQVWAVVWRTLELPDSQR